MVKTSIDLNRLAQCPPNSDSAEHSLMRLLDEINVGVIILSRQSGAIRYFNKHVSKSLKHKPEEIIGQSYLKIFRPEFIPVYEQLASECCTGEEHSLVYYWPEKTLWEQVSIKETVWNGEQCMLLCIAAISDIIRTKYKHENIVYFDSTLHLPNGEKLEKDINELASLETVSVIYIAFDRFIEINNLYGWENGNLLLKKIRDWLLNTEKRRAQLYVIDKGFAILGRNVDMNEIKERTAEIVNRFTQNWSVPADEGEEEIFVFYPVKVGAVHGKYIRNEMRNILLRTTWMEPNSEGYTIYDEEADKKIRRTLAIRNWLVQCVHNNMKGFDVHYQPIVKLDSMKWMAVEALCRWTAPNGEQVSPFEFIHIAEQLGLIGQIDSWVRKKAMQDCVKLGLDKKNFFLSVNFSPTRKVDQDFMQDLIDHIKNTGFPADKLNLEITESAKMSFEKENLDSLRHLEEAGVMLCLDDFGTGYSSISNLVNVSAQILKTEKQFIDGIEDDPYRQYLLSAVTKLTQHLKMSLIVEGVETETQLNLMKKHDIDYVQGYYFSRPLPYDRLSLETSRFN